MCIRDSSLRYAGAAGSCAGMQAQHGPFDLPAKGTVVFYQGNVSGLPTGDSGLPVGCAASALIEASVPVAAVVNSIDLLGASTAAALARPLNQGATMNALPILSLIHIYFRWLGYAALLAALWPIGRMVADLLSWQARRYVISTRRVMEIEGVINRMVRDSNLDKVNDLVLRLSLIHI